MQWDVFCRVIDNFGDIGVCWRLAADLAARGEAVRLWVDDASSLSWMAPDGASGRNGGNSVKVLDWRHAAREAPSGEVVVEAFGCELPAEVIARMARRAPAPVWINLEYLSAEAYAQRSHGLPSPQLSGPGTGLTKWFFYPGFSAGTGGLIREADLGQQQHDFDAAAWLALIGCARRPHERDHRRDERVVSLFCYRNARLPDLLDALAAEPTLLLVAAGAGSQQVAAELGPTLQRGALRAHLLPLLPQADYDRLLWASDINFVRGEDSFVRAQWAGKPFVWQLYPQQDGAHALKLRAFCAMFAGTTGGFDLWPCGSAWNALTTQALQLPPMNRWCAASREWRSHLLTQPDLVSQLLSFAAERR